MKVAVSYISSNYSVSETINLIDNSQADYIHVDLMDGKYVDTNNFVIEDIGELLKKKKKPLDIHLMVEKPEQYLLQLSKLNISCITIHSKTTEYPEEVINIIKSLGIKSGIAINPDEELKEFSYLLPIVDQVLVMSVKPGKGGQEFIDEVIPKIDELIKLKEKFNFIIAVDGGINDKSIKKLPKVDMVISGSYICKSSDYDEKIKSLKN